MNRSSVIASLSAALCLSIAACAAAQEWDPAPAGDAPGAPPTTTVERDDALPGDRILRRPLTAHTPVAW